MRTPDFPATNRKALQHGCLDAKSQRKFAVNKPVMTKLIKPRSSPSSRNHNFGTGKSTTGNNNNNNNKHLSMEFKKSNDQTTVNDRRVYGIKSVPNQVAIKDLLKSPSGDFEESDYPDLTNRQTRGRLPPAKMTKAYEASIKKRREEEKNNNSKKNKFEFKMKRFQNIESKVKSMLQ